MTGIKRSWVICLLPFLLVTSSPLALSFFLPGSAGDSPQSGSKLNLLLITINTLRADRVSFYSQAHLQTPHFDALLKKSVVFTRAFAHAPTTLPSHTSILLGTTPFYHGVHDNANFVVQPEFVSLAELLRSQGYRAGAFVGGFLLESRFGLDQGFDVYDDNFNQPEADIEKGRERRAEKVATRARDWLSHQPSPWFLWVHCFDPHDPYTPPEPYRTQFATRLYDGEVAYTEGVIGNFLRHLDEALLFLGLAHLSTGNKEKSLAFFLKYKASRSYARLSPAEKNRLEEYIARAKMD